MDARALLELMRAGEFTDDVQFFLRGAAGRILANLDAGRPPDADVELLLKAPPGRPAQPPAYSHLGIALQIAAARLDGHKLYVVREQIAERYGISVAMVRKIEAEQGDLRRMVERERKSKRPAT